MHLILICVGVYLHTRVRTRVSRRRGHDKYALLLLRVYLQSVTLIQRNDYFYFRYFASLFPLSGTAPHWPTDYLCGGRHTWPLSPSSLLCCTFGSFGSHTPSPVRVNTQGVEGHRGPFTPLTLLYMRLRRHNGVRTAWRASGSKLPTYIHIFRRDF